MKTTTEVWELYRTQDALTRVIVSDYAEEIQSVVGEAFAGTSKRPTLEIEGLLKTSDIVGLITSSSGIDGVVSISVPDSPLLGQRMIWVNKVALTPAFQQKEIGTSVLLNDLQTFFPEERIGFLGCMTQNPALINKYTAFTGTTFPTQAWYSDPVGTRILSYLYCEVSQFQERIQNTKNRDINIDSVHGIIHCPYQTNIVPPSSRERFKMPSKHIERLLEVGFNPDQGDAVILVISF